MSSATYTNYESWLTRVSWLLIGVAIIETLLLLIPFVKMREGVHGSASTPEALVWGEPGPAPTADWSVFEKRGAGVGGVGAPGKRFRLAGTFFMYMEGFPDTRKAVLDDSRDKTHRIVSENEDLGGIIVVRVLRDSVLLRTSDGQEEELILGFTGAGVAGIAQGGAGEVSQAGSNRYGGKQLGERSWSFNRSALLDYYQELRDEPQRLLAVFDSLKPQYDDNQRINGYRLGIEGEKDFFAASGLKEGDVVRKVNELPMTNRRRAERFITDFVNNRANAFVIEVERNGTAQKLVYQTR